MWFDARHAIAAVAPCTAVGFQFQLSSTCTSFMLPSVSGVILGCRCHLYRATSWGQRVVGGTARDSGTRQPWDSRAGKLQAQYMAKVDSAEDMGKGKGEDGRDVVVGGEPRWHQWAMMGTVERRGEASRWMSLEVRRRERKGWREVVVMMWELMRRRGAWSEVS